MLGLSDFNDILQRFAVKGGEFCPRCVARLAEALENCDLLDIEAVGGKFTWFRRVQGNRDVSKRLDRMVANCEWSSLF